MIVVDLPAPLGPMYPTSSPGSMVKADPVKGGHFFVFTTREPFDCAPETALPFGDPKTFFETFNDNLRFHQASDGVSRRAQREPVV